MSKDTESLRPISTVAAELGIREEAIRHQGIGVAKIDPLHGMPEAGANGRLVLVSAITPTRAGVGKTTVTVALSMALRKLGHRVLPCLREPSMGPVFGIKGGGTGGGKAQVVPADDINLHFTGDMHAITSAHNVLAAMVDHDLYFGSESGLDPTRVHWPRVLDVNDRALRNVMTSVGSKNPGANRATRFDITAASEVMAILSLATSLEDLRVRLGRIAVGRRADGSPVTADDLESADVMTVLLRHALEPNLVQTTEGGPAFVHGGPFANIAHGCSSVAATRLAMRLSDVVVTEAGFGFELGGEKFLQIKCRQSGIWPNGVVLVVTIRALAVHGAGAPGEGDASAVRRGLEHLDRQVANVRAFGLPAVVAINVFQDDAEANLQLVETHCDALGMPHGRCTGFVDGGDGALDLGRTVQQMIEREPRPEPHYLYALDEGYEQKLEKVATTLYGASQIHWTPQAQAELAEIEVAGGKGLPICVAKTQLSLSDDPKRVGVPRDFELTVQSVRLSAGAGFVVVLLGKVMTMPGLPRDPAAKRIRMGEDGIPVGLMQGEQG